MTPRADKPDTAAATATTNGLTDAGGFLTRDAILGADDIQYDIVDVPEWGGPGAQVRVRSLTASERDAYDAESYLFAGKEGDQRAMLTDFRVRRVARAIVDHEGNSLFSPRDIAELGGKNAQVVDRVDDAVAKLSGMDTEAVKRALEALKDAPSGGSGTA